MKRIAFSASLALFLSCSATDGNAEKPPAFPVLWEVSDGLEAPESAYFDKGSGFLFVSQVGGGGPTGKDGDGCIAKLTPDGNVIDNKWIAGLNAPKGLRSHDGKLWVSDIDRIVGIDIEKGEIAATVEVTGAKFLNDVACDAEGAVYVSDMTASKIYCYKDDEVSVFAEGVDLENPNGLLVDGDRLIVAAWGSGGTAGMLYSLFLY
jgi:sugar lactone lactonase YvrE